MTGTTQNLTMRRRWLIFLLVFFLGVCTTTNMMKAPPIYTTLIPALGFTDETIGWVVSCFSIMTVALAFPAGWLIQKVGIKRLLVISGCATVCGSLLGSFATDMAFMLFSRFIEGFGMGIMVVVGPVAVDTVMPARLRGLAMGIWAAYFPAGIFIGLLVAPSLSNAFGWAAMWWLIALFGAIATVLNLVFYAEPEGEETALQEPAQKDRIVTALKPDYRSIIFAGVAFFTWNAFWGSGIDAFYPTFLQEVMHFPNTTAGYIVAIPNIIIMVTGPLAGRLTDKLGTRKWFIVVALVEVVILLFIAFSGNLALTWVFIFAISLAAAVVPTALFAIVPVLAKRPEARGRAMAIVMVFAQSGILIGSAVFEPIRALVGGWPEVSFFYLIPVVTVGVIFTLLIREKRVRKSVPNDSHEL